MSLKRAEICVPAYAKVNLFLDITGRLDNGYHTLNTVMQQVGLCDNVTVRVKDGKGISLSCDVDGIPCDERNIAFKAAETFLNKVGLEAEILIDIEKKIPVMAGLGGSSADGAAVLAALNRLYGGVLSGEELERLGAALGADVPFCLRGGTAVCNGIGDEMRSVKGLGENCFLVIVKPDFACDTAEGYRLFDRQPAAEKGDFDGFLRALDKGTAETGKALYNVFEGLYRDERIERLKNKLAEAGAAGACLTGSGSAVFGVFDDGEKAERAIRQMQYRTKFLTKPLYGT
ncbi:MAG: 4-(cytidine 5'-diphospho)-2-C-methyl-D-erythritol kinase [Oscillospiraceae bacterium]|nr:4-(cytidine 5'-diphospho)-2-C-methyl-D-erythritol kinase [Oscillospiraceae bacterium]